ncbi:MAG: L-threonylcarbamoyladenylate synthase [Planctomycetaceae bacterium]
MSVSSILTKDVSFAAELIRQGLLVAFPTETVYGLGADATNSAAVAGIFEAKRRPAFDPLIVHLPNSAAAAQLVLEFPPAAGLLAERFWPGPLTLVLPKKPLISDLVTAGLPGVGIRVPCHPVALRLLNEAACPIAAPSANPFGKISPTTAQHVVDGLGGRIDAVLDGGPCSVGLESTVVSFMHDAPLLLRHGGLPLEMIEDAIGPIHVATSNPANDDAAQSSPGMLSRHYAPGIPLRLRAITENAVPCHGLRCGLLTVDEARCGDGFVRVHSVGSTSDLRTCAANFFASLRSLDSAGLDVIIAHRFPDHGLGVALNDRLERASRNDLPTIG